MAGSSLLALIDDIATLLDDVAVLSKIAAKKTAGVLGDDLAVNAEQVTGVSAKRELPVVWAVFKGSMRNKLILVPAALLLSAIAPWLVLPLLMCGGAFLCYEGFEKIVHSFQKHEHKHNELLAAVKNKQVDIVAFEKKKISGAIRTDFILSAEIIAITLGIVADSDMGTRIAVLSFIAVAMTVGVYGLVAGIVKLDDAGFYLNKKQPPLKHIGLGLILGAPYLMKALSIFGTAAMFLVGGGILVHGIEPIHHALEHFSEGFNSQGWLVITALQGTIGLIAGAILVAIMSVLTTIFKTK